MLLQSNLYAEKRHRSVLKIYAGHVYWEFGIHFSTFLFQRKKTLKLESGDAEMKGIKIVLTVVRAGVSDYAKCHLALIS